MSFSNDLRNVERVTIAFCVPVFISSLGMLIFSMFLQGWMLEYLFIKVFLTLAFFATLITAAFWAGEKFKEYWGDDEDGRQSTSKIYGKNLRSYD